MEIVASDCKGLENLAVISTWSELVTRLEVGLLLIET